MKKIIALFVLASVITQAASARNWDRVEIPGAVCGDGLQYSVFVNRKAKSNNLLIEFMGGGVCWDFNTCYGKEVKTWMHPMPEIPAFSYMTNDFKSLGNRLFNEDSAIYLPYCTGDVFSADHVANYSGIGVYHRGYRNVVLAFQYLAQKNVFNFSNIDRVTVYGASAGAIGALVHLKTIEPYFTKAKKIGVIDSAGLHFGPTFWKKFPAQLLVDFTKTFTSVGLFIDPNDGFVAQYIGPVLANLKNWKLGFLQATRDVVMSVGFGDITPEEHRELVLSDRGLAAIAKNYPNTMVWTTDSSMHTFMLFRSTSDNLDMKNESAINFVSQLVNTSLYLE